MLDKDAVAKNSISTSLWQICAGNFGLAPPVHTSYQAKIQTMVATKHSYVQYSALDINHCLLKNINVCINKIVQGRHYIEV